MEAIFNVDTGTLERDSSGTPVDMLVAQRGSGEHIQIRLLKGGITYEAPALAQLAFVVKRQLEGETPEQLTPDFDGVALAGTSAFSYDSEFGVYAGTVNYIDSALNDLMLVGQDLEAKYAMLVCQVAWRRNSSSPWNRSQWVPFKLFNNVWRGTETFPEDDDSENNGGPFNRPAVIHTKVDTASNSAANSLKDVTDLKFPVASGKTYGFRFMIPYTSAATSTGSRWTLNGPATSFLTYSSCYTLTATSRTDNYAAAYGVPAACNASSLTAGNVAVIEGIITPSADGYVQAQFASKVLNSAITAKKGANVTYWEMDMA
jgi:hypothetical protein